MTTREPRTAGLTSDEADEIERQARTQAAPPPAEAVEELLVDALAYALARAQVPDKMEGPRDYAARLTPLIVESGYLAALPISPPALDVDRLAQAIVNLTDGDNFPLASDSADDLAAEYASLAEQPKEPQP